MAARHAALLLCPLMMWAQTPSPQPSPAPPAAVDQALRARVTEFLQYFVDGQYRKALKLVAEESQDLYFGSSKADLKSFKLEDIKYEDDFQKATVYFSAERTWKLHFEGLTEVPVQVQMSSTWKMEDGQWAWYYKPEAEPWITAMGPSNAELISRKPDGTVQVPKGINQDTADAAATTILHQTKLDKNQITLLRDKPSSDKISLHNGVNGPVRAELLDIPPIPGFSVKLSKADLNAGEDAGIDISYNPPADFDPDFVLPSPVAFGVVIQPFQQTFIVEVEFKRPDKQ